MMKTMLLLAVSAAVMIACERPLPEASPPAGEGGSEVRYPRMETVKRGDQCGIQRADQVVIRDADAWASFWIEFTSNQEPPDPEPEIDFENEQVLGVFLGPKSSAGFGVEILEVTLVDEVLRVAYRESEPDEGMMAAAVITYPYHLVKTMRHEGTVRFEKR
ncbi:MAG: protease complex subunit PrcB family protein [Planctomycetota bacterium]